MKFTRNLMGWAVVIGAVVFAANLHAAWAADAREIKIKFLAPREGDVIAGDLYNLRAMLSPATPEAHAQVERVFFWADFRPNPGQTKGGISAAFNYQNGVYQGTWDTTKFDEGAHLLGVSIYDKRNRVIASDEIKVVVRNRTE